MHVFMQRNENAKVKIIQKQICKWIIPEVENKINGNETLIKDVLEENFSELKKYCLACLFLFPDSFCSNHIFAYLVQLNKSSRGFM